MLSGSTAPYVGRGNLCTGNNDTCTGPRVGGEVFCAGHLRSWRKQNGLPTKGPLSLGGTPEGDVAVVAEDDL